jgi:hypothetical protein
MKSIDHFLLTVLKAAELEGLPDSEGRSLRIARVPKICL